MKQIYKVLLLLLVLMLASSCGICEETLAFRLNEDIDKAFRNHKTVGAAVVVARDGEIVYEHYYGFAVKKQREPVTENTYFRLASVTKMVTAIRAMKLVEEDKLSLDQDISDYLGYEVQNPYHRKTPVTLRMLMTHTSSLDPHGGYYQVSNTLRQLISTDKLKRSNWYDEIPGTQYRYSNFGAGIIGSLMESVTGTNIDQDMQNNVFIPLGITASYSAGLLPDPENIPNIYNADGSIADTREYSINKDWGAGVDPDRHYRINVGSLWMRPTDLCKIGILLCEGGTYQNTTLLQPETVQEMMSEQRGKGGITAKTPYGLCIHHETTLLGTKTLYGHQGLYDGIVCNLYYDPETRFVFVLCSNGCNNAMDNRVVHLTRRIFDFVWKEFGNN